MSNDVFERRALSAVMHALSNTLDIQPEAIQISDRIVADLGADSMATLTILILIEEELNVAIEPETLQIGDATVSEVCNRLVLYLTTRT